MGVLVMKVIGKGGKEVGKEVQVAGSSDTFAWADGKHVLSLTWHGNDLQGTLDERKVVLSDGSKLILKDSRVVFRHKD